MQHTSLRTRNSCVLFKEQKIEKKMLQQSSFYQLDFYRLVLHKSKQVTTFNGQLQLKFTVKLVECSCFLLAHIPILQFQMTTKFSWNSVLNQFRWTENFIKRLCIVWSKLINDSLLRHVCFPNKWLASCNDKGDPIIIAILLVVMYRSELFLKIQ